MIITTKQKSNLLFCIVLILMLPLFLINTKNYSSWDDDASQYIQQGINIVKCIPQKDNGYLFNPAFEMLGPPLYPIGFPLLLSPVIIFYGNNILAFNILETIFLCLWGLIAFCFFRKHLGILLSILLCISIVYNPYVLENKIDIMSDIPFAFFFLASTLLYNYFKNSNKLYITFIIGTIVGFTISIRTIGYCIPASIIACGLISFIKNKNSRTSINSIIIATVSIIFNLLINFCFFGESKISTYENAFTYTTLSTFITNNSIHYYYSLTDFFAPSGSFSVTITITIGIVMLSLFLIGLFKSILKTNITEVLTISYLITILIYPYSKGGIRFLMPILPFVFYYVINGLQVFTKNKTNRKIMSFVSASFMIIILTGYSKPIHKLWLQRKNVVYGPQEWGALDAFYYIKNNTPNNAIFDFIKPRALALYTSRKAMSHSPNCTIKNIQQQQLHFKVNYILINTEISDDSIKTYLIKFPSETKLLWSNEKFSLYKKL